MTCYPIKWGFIRDLRHCVGKTIKAAYSVKMEYACSAQHAWLVSFEDGTRAFFTDHVVPARYSMNPCQEAFEMTPIFTVEEMLEVAADRKIKSLRTERETHRRKLAQLARLKKELGIDT